MSGCCMFLVDSGVAAVPNTDSPPARRSAKLWPAIVRLTARAWSALGAIGQALTPPDPPSLRHYRYVGRGQYVPRPPGEWPYAPGEYK